jgi:hypothetical protein
MIRHSSDCTPADAGTVQQAAQQFVDTLFGQYRDPLVLLRLFITVPYDLLPEDDRLFVDGRGTATGTSRLIHGATPIFTLFGSRGRQPEWNDRHSSAHFRCIPLASTAFIASLTMLSRQLTSVDFDLELIDNWQTEVAAVRRADRFRGLLHIRDAAVDRDAQGRLIVPKQDFVAEWGVQSVFGFGSGYDNYPALVTLFAFTDRELSPEALLPCAGQLEQFIAATRALAAQERFFR